ncbi:MAG: hypothetical protein V4689_22510 [Verrucomicrobiota bacterium]
MAEGKNNEQLKQQAIANLATSRAQLSREWNRLQHDLGPKQVMQRAVKRHKPALVGIAAVAGLLVGLWAIRRKPVARLPRFRDEGMSAPAAKVAGLGVMGLIVQAAIPLILKSISPGLILDLIEKRRRGPQATGPGERQQS